VGEIGLTMGKTVETKIKITSFRDRKESRLSSLEIEKKYYLKRGYIFKEYIEGRKDNSYAIFEVDEDKLKKEKLIKNGLLIFIVIMLILLFYPVDKTVSEQSDSTPKTQQVEEKPIVNTSTNKELEPSKEQALEAKTNQDASLEESDMVQEYLHRQLAEEAGADYDAMQSNLQKNMELLREKYSQ